MYITLILLITVTIIGVHNVILPSRIENDAAQWSKLYLKYIQRAPPGTIRTYYTQSCQIVRECCPRQRNYLYNIITENKLADKCIKAQDRVLSKSQSLKCKNSIQSWNNLVQTPVYVEFKSAIQRLSGSFDRESKRRFLMLRACSSNEREAYYCEPEDAVRIRSCAEKVLLLVSREQSNDSYDTFVRNFKNDFNRYYEGVREAFP